MASLAEAIAIVEIVNRRHGTTLRQPELAPAGESEPWILRDRTGAAYLLKWSDGAEFRVESAIEITRRLRLRGYPIFPYVAAGRAGAFAYSVRAMVAGRPMSVARQPLEARYVPRLIELNDLQANAAAGSESDWPAWLRTSILTGFKEWCVLERLRNYSSETAAMLAEMQALARAATPTLRTSDAVHGDFSGANVLVEDGRVTAVIDWEGARAGDRAFDLATLLYYEYFNPPVRERLLARLGEIASREAIALYLAHMIVRQVEWSISHHAPEAVEHYLGIARALMRDLGA